MLTYTDIGAGVPIVFVHGLGSRKEAWLPQHELSSSYRLILVDLRGHGGSVVEDDISLRNFAKDIIELLEHLHIEYTYVCGLSLGGIVAQELHSQRPDLIAGLILANTTPYIPSMMMFRAMDEVRKSYNKGTLVDEIIGRGFYDTRLKETARDSFLIRSSYIDSAYSAIGHNYITHLCSIRCPTLILGSSHDKVIPVLNVPFMHFLISGSKSHIFQDTGHLSNIEKPDEFNKQIKQFIG